MKHINIEGLYELTDKYQEFFDMYKQEVPVVLYGAGKGCIDALEMFLSEDVVPVAICDSDKSKHGKLIQGIRVCSLEEIIKSFKEYYIFISAPVFAKEIKEYLKNFVEESKILFFGKFREKTAHKQYVEENADFIIRLYNQLEDEKSKITLMNMLKGWITCDYEYFSEVYEPNQYFPKDVIELTEQEVFLDVGSYTGDTAIEFIENVNEKYKKIVAFEPNDKCFGELEMLQNRFNNITHIKKGAYEFKERLAFNNDSSISRASAHITNNSDNGYLIEVDSIDNLVYEDVTFIKIDIEGAELAALKGAIETIKENKPKLAICVYHNYKDIVEIPRFLMGLGIEYKYYLRHHSFYTGETVFYAV